MAYATFTCLANVSGRQNGRARAVEECLFWFGIILPSENWQHQQRAGPSMYTFHI